MTSCGRRGPGIALVAGALGLAVLPQGVPAQSLAEGVREAGGTVVFHFEVREDVEVCDDGIVIDGETRMHRGRWDHRDRRNCSRGVAEAVATVREGRVEGLELEAWEGAGFREEGATDLGRAAPEAAADFFLGLARDPGAARRAAESAIMAATLVRDVVVWPRLLELARDRELEGKIRSSAIFWLGQTAADAATVGLADLAGDADEEQDVRDAAVFALSQRPDDEAIPVLMELARTAGEARTRRTAMFWLAQSKDPRILSFFEEILRDRPGG